MIPTPENIAKLKREKEKDNLKNLAKIKNSLVESLVKKNNANALKILFFIAKDSSSFKPDGSIVKITLDSKTLCSYTGLIPKTLRQNLLTMMETTISFYEDTFEEHIILLPRVHISYGGKIEIDIYSKVFNLISEARNKYTSIDTTNLMKLRSKHSIRMIMLLEYISGFGPDVPKSKRYYLSELNGMFGTNYKYIKDFIKNILLPVREELDKVSKLSFIYSLHLDKDDISRGGRPAAKGVNIFLTDNINPRPTLI